MNVKTRVAKLAGVGALVVACGAGLAPAAGAAVSPGPGPGPGPGHGNGHGNGYGNGYGNGHSRKHCRWVRVRVHHHWRWYRICRWY